MVGIGVGQQADLPDQDGWVTIKNGQVIVCNPRGCGKFPTLTPDKNVQVFLNGEKIVRTAFVHEGDSIKLQPLNTEPFLNLEVKLSSDKLKAFLQIHKKPGKRYVVEDMPPTGEATVKASIAQVIWPQLTFEQVRDLLHQNQVVYGINEEAIRQALELEDENMSIEVAAGQAPIPPQDAGIVYTFQNSGRFQGTIEPYGQGNPLSVAVGTVLAVKSLPVDGKAGMDVTGKIIPPRPPRDEPILSKSGVSLIQNGAVAVAAVSGKPVLEGSVRKYLSVQPVHIINGDVDRKTGNIKFKGNIVVTGSVLDGFGVEAGGSIEVWGDVLHASLYANNEIIIHNKAITARIQAGGLSSQYRRIYGVLKHLADRLKQLLSSMEVLKRQPSFNTADLKLNGEGRLVQLLMDFKYKDVPKLVNDFLAVLAETENWPQQELVELGRDLNEKLCNLGPLRIKKQAEMELLSQEVQQTLETLMWLISNTADVQVGYVQNSVVRASGNIIVKGQGSIVSELDAAGQILISGGKVRGGRLTAREKIQVQELGSPNDAQVIIRMLDNCCLEANIVHPVVTIEHGADHLVIAENCRRLRASVGKDGDLRLEREYPGTRKEL
ncbi:FapA family protein [Paradesulfitobacterium aromaticivorans]